MDNRRDFQKEADAYFLALGKFVHDFSRLEARLQWLLWHTAQTDTRTAKAIFSGTRIDGCVNYIRRIREAKGEPESKYLDKALQQIPIINNLRNDIVHYGASFVGDEFIPTVSTKRTHQDGKERIIQVPAKTLENARTDIETILACLNGHELSGLLDSLRKYPLWQQIADREWLYKLGQPSDRPKQRQRNTQTQSHRREPS